MNIKTIRILPIVVLLIFSIDAKAQLEKEDNKQDTCIATTVNSYNNMIKYFMAEENETKQLLKVDIIQLAQLRYNLWYEHQVSKKLSFEAGAELCFFEDFDPNYQQKNLIPKNDNDMFFAPEFKLKYFIKSDNNQNFNGQYISFGLSAHIYKFGEPQFVDFFPDGTIDYGHFNLPNKDSGQSGFQFKTNKYSPAESRYLIFAGYGIQQTIGRIGFYGIETKLGFGTNAELTNYYLLPEFKLKAGFSISSIRPNKK